MKFIFTKDFSYSHFKNNYAGFELPYPLQNAIKRFINGKSFINERNGYNK